MDIQTKDLSGHALNYAVSKAMGRENPIYRFEPEPGDKDFDPTKDCSDYFYILGPRGVPGPFDPSTDWAKGGPIIEREGISWHCGNKTNWHAYAYGNSENMHGPTPLIAAMRCYVASKLGETVDIPEGLTK